MKSSVFNEEVKAIQNNNQVSIPVLEYIIDKITTQTT